MKTIIVLNGIHGSGKSTVGSMLTQSFPQFAYFYEIGGKLRTEVNYNTMSSGLEFDKEVMNRELARDIELLKSSTIPIVETWHMGNLAYAMNRSPELVKKYKSKLQKQLQLFEPIGFTFEISPDIFLQRISEYVPSEKLDDYIRFFNQISQNTFDIYSSLGIKHYVINNDGSLDETYQELIRLLRENGINPEGNKKKIERT